MQKDRRSRKWYILLPLLVVLAFMILVSGCTGEDTPTTSPDQVPDEKDSTQEIIPDWLYEAMGSHFEDGMTIEKDQIAMLQVNLKRDATSQIAAYTKVDDLNGVFALYEKQDGENGAYQEVYVKKEPVLGVHVFGDNTQKQQIAFVSGFGGAGQQENYFHLLAFTEDGYKEVWSEIAERDKMSGTPPYFKVIGSMNLAIEQETLIYSQYKESYHQNDQDVTKPDEVAESVQVYRFNSEKGVYEKTS